MNRVGRVKTRIWVIQVELRSNFNEAEANFKHKEALSLSTALPELELAGSQVVKISSFCPSAIFTKQKQNELQDLISCYDVKIVFMNCNVSPVQQKNLEKAWNVKILDRTSLILEIFSNRAATREGVLQVEMAALSYQRTRLVRAWTHLERQRGGLGFVGGPGETQIESDRRAIDSQLKSLERQLRKVVKTRELHRKRRSKTAMPIISLVGYTNAGKSALFNKLTNEDVVCKDMLFATLDPTVRISELRSGFSVIMTDTVGFISDLPTELIASFRSTLEEVLNSDIILHVRDISHPNTDNHSQDVSDILEKIGLDENIPVLEVWNKIDLHSECQKLQQPDISLNKRKIYPVCAASGAGLENLKTGIINVISARYSKDIRNVSVTDGKRRAWLYRNGVVESARLIDENYKMVLRWSEKQRKQFDLL